MGLDHYINLLTGDKSFLDLSTFPPEGAIWNNVLWAIFYTSVVIFLGLVVAVLASRVRYESAIKAVVFLPMAIAATALAIIWNFVYAPDANIGLLNAILDPVHGARDLVAGQPVPRERGAHRRGHLGSVGFATVILSAALEEHPERGPRGGADGRRERTPGLLRDHHPDGEPADLGPGRDAAGQRREAVRPDLRADEQWRPGGRAG